MFRTSNFTSFKGTLTPYVCACIFFVFDDGLFFQIANVMCEHHHLLSLTPFLTFDVIANADVTCEQGLTDHTIIVRPLWALKLMELTTTTKMAKMSIFFWFSSYLICKRCVVSITCV